GAARICAAAATGALVAGLLIATGVTAGATTRSVNCSSGGNLQTAINNANPGDIIDVTGTCRGHFTINKSLTLTSDGAVLDGTNNGRVLYVGTPNITVKLEELTIKNGNVGGVVCECFDV